MSLLLNITDFNPYNEHSKEALYRQPVSTTLFEHNLCRLAGPNGVGKSTLFRALVGLNASFNGTIRWTTSGTTLSGMLALRQHGVIYMPQKGYSLRSLSVGELRRLLASRPLRPQVVAMFVSFLSKFEFSEDTRIGELSGGQQQMCALLATLAQPGRLYLLDEPFRSIDRVRKVELLEIFRDIFGSARTGLLLADHDCVLDGVLEFDADIKLAAKEG